MNWYAKAAALGNPIAQNMCGTIEYEDLIVKSQRSPSYMFGTEWEKVRSYFSAAAKQGNPNAQYMLGVLYENGHGVCKSPDEACQWYQKAAAQGHSEAKKKL
jgi:TPR repeat protein